MTGEWLVKLMNESKLIDCSEKEKPRVLGLAMIPGHYIASIHIDSFTDGVVS